MVRSSEFPGFGVKLYSISVPDLASVVTVTSATLEEGKQAGCEDKSGSLNTYNRSFIKFHDLEIPSFFLSNKTRKEPVKSLPVFWHKSKFSPGLKSPFSVLVFLFRMK